MKALPVINECARLINDAGFVRVQKDDSAADNKANWLDWLNNAQRAVASVRPDAAAETALIVMEEGTKQALPAGSIKLLGVVRNMGIDGATPGRVITLSSREDLDSVNPDWHTADGEGTVDHVLYEEKKNPLVFYVTPPADDTDNQIEVELAVAPADVADADTGDLTLESIYQPALVEWMLYEYYAMATQSQGNLQRAGAHFQAFFNLLGVKIKADMFLAAAGPGMYPPASQASGA